MYFRSVPNTTHHSSHLNQTSTSRASAVSNSPAPQPVAGRAATRQASPSPAEADRAIAHLVGKVVYTLQEQPAAPPQAAKSGAKPEPEPEDNIASRALEVLRDGAMSFTKRASELGEKTQLALAQAHRTVAKNPDLSRAARRTEIRMARRYENEAAKFLGKARGVEHLGKVFDVLDGIDVAKKVSEGNYRDAAAKVVGMGVGTAATAACDTGLGGAEVLAAPETGGASALLLPETAFVCSAGGSAIGWGAEEVAKPVIDVATKAAKPVIHEAKKVAAPVAGGAKGVWHGIKSGFSRVF